MANWRDSNQSNFPQIITSGTGSSHTGDTSITTIATAVIPANKLLVGDTIRVQGIYEIDDGSGGAPASTMTTRTYVDGSSMASVGGVARSLSVNKSLNAKSSTTLECPGNTYYRDEKGSTWAELPVDITADITITFTCQLANAADYGHVRGYTIQLLRA